MKKAIIAAGLAASLVASTGTAGSLSDPALERDVIVQEATSSSSGKALVGLLAIILAIPVLDGGSNGLTTASDERLKTDISRVGNTASGLPLYTFRYQGDSALYRGVMAQDVLQAKPEAVITGARGFMAVDYSMIDAEMIRVE